MNQVEQDLCGSLLPERNKKMKKIILALTIVMVAAGFAVADTIYLRDGRTIQGTLLGFINGRFVVRVESRQSNFPRATTDPNVARDRAYEGQIQYFRPEEVERRSEERRVGKESGWRRWEGVE